MVIYECPEQCGLHHFNSGWEDVVSCLIVLSWLPVSPHTGSGTEKLYLQRKNPVSYEHFPDASFGLLYCLESSSMLG